MPLKISFLQKSNLLAKIYLTKADAPLVRVAKYNMDKKTNRTVKNLNLIVIELIILCLKFVVKSSDEKI